MDKSLFLELVVKFFANYILRLTEFINGKEGTQRYMFAEMLEKQFTGSMKWTNININGRAVMADVVALDANFPLKQRGKLATAEGTIPKLATKRYLNETQMAEIIQLQDSRINRETEIASILFADTKAVTVGIWERLEYMFLQGLSSGVFAIDDENNVGLKEIRVSLGHPDEQKFGAVTKWSDADAKPIDDIERIVNAASTMSKPAPRVIYMDVKTWNKFRNNQQVKEQIAGYLRYPITQNLGTPKMEVINEFLGGEYGVTIRKIDRSVIFEKNGKDTSITCWTDNAVVFMPAETGVGKLFYGTLPAEVFVDETREQQKVDDYILVQKYSEKGDTPLEVTSSQAIAIPVPDMANIFILDVEEAQPTGDTIQTDNDTTITIYGSANVSRAKLMSTLTNMGVTVSPTAKDSTLVKKVNELNEDQEMQLKIALSIPIISAGEDKEVTANNTTLTGTAEAANDRTISTNVWSKVSGPAGGTLTTPNALTTAVTALETGTYVFKLTVTDSAGLITTDEVVVNVNL